MARVEWVDTQPKTNVEPPTVKATIHNVFILDTSSSMDSYGRFTNAKAALLEQIKELKKSTEVDYTFSILQFSDADKIEFVLLKSNGKGEVRLKNPNGWTALNDAIGTTVNTFLNDEAIKDDQVVLKICTDGEENRSEKFKASQIATLLKKVQAENNWVVTFIGTKADVAEATKLYNIDASNTLVHNNTGEDISRAISYDTVSTVNYSKRIKDGNLSNTEFYNNNN